MDYIFIVNPKSRTGQGELLWSQLEPELKKRRVSYEVRMTGRKKDAERIATEITADEEEHTMIVLGGDGSLNEVINGIKNPSIFLPDRVMILQEAWGSRKMQKRHWS